MARPRILILTPVYPPLVGGAATFYGLIAPMLARDLDVTVLTEQVAGRPSKEILGNLTVLRWLPSHVGSPGRPFWKRALTMGSTHLAFLPLLRWLSADLIHYHTIYRGPVVKAALKLSGSRLLADVRDTLCHPEQHAVVADEMLSCTENLNAYLDHLSIRYRFLPVPIPMPEQPGDVPRGEYVLFVGDVAPHKGVPELLEAFPIWRGSREVRLVLVGPNFLGDLPPWVEYLGPLSSSEVASWMAGARMLVLPSRTEALGGVVLEALSLGTPALCPPGVPEFARTMPQCVLADHEIPTLVETMERVWNLETLPSYPFEAHDPEAVVRQLTDLYREMLSAPR